MTRLTIAPNTQLFLAERSLVVPAIVLGLAAGLNAFFWLRSRRPVASLAGRAALLIGCLAAGLVAVGGLILMGGAIAEGFGWACAAAALTAVIFTSYHWGTKGASLGSSILLLLLRLLAIAILVLLYFEPTLKLINRDVRRSKLLVLVDASGSMKINDGPNRISRLAWVQSELLGKRGVLTRLGEDFEVELYAFADGLDQIEPGELAELKPVGRSTTLAPTVGEACAKVDKLETTGAMVFSDGIDNSGHDPVAHIARSGLPVFPVAVGSKLREKGDFKDIAVARVDYERYIAADNKTEITAHIEAVGLNRRRVAVRFHFDGKQKDEQMLVLDDFPGTQSVKLAFTPSQKGTYKCSVDVTEAPEERITDNNKKELDVIVTDPSIKVLLIEGVIRAEYKWQVRTLQMDPNVALLALVQVRKGVFNQQGNVKDIRLSGFPKDYDTLKKFNVLLFGDIDRSFFTSEQLTNIQKFVEAGGGLLMTGGYSSLGPGGYAATPVEDVLPVRLGSKDIGQEKDAFAPTLTPDGATHPILSGIAPFFATGTAPAKRPLPPLMGCTRVGPVKPGATTLVIHPRRTGSDGKPLVIAAVQRYGQGHSMVLAADTTWRWYLGLRGLGRETPYIKFWGQAMRWLAGKEIKEAEEKGLTAYTDRRYYEPGQTVRIYARVRDKQGQATNQANVTATVHGPAGPPVARQIPYIPGTTGKYEVDFDPPSPGEYKMNVQAELLDGPVDKAKLLQFQVGRPNLEFDKLDLNDALLKRLADKTKGKYVTMVGLNNFVGQLKSREEAKSTITSVDVWSDDSLSLFGQRLSPYLLVAFGLFVAAVTAEWVLRKRRQLI